MLGLRQSLVTTGRVGGGITLFDLNGIGTPQDGGTILIYQTTDPSLNNKTIAYSVVEKLIPIFSNSGSIPKYVGNWEECRDFAQSIILSSQMGDEDAKFVGSNLYSAGETYTNINPDPRFNIYPHLYDNLGITQYGYTIIGGVQTSEAVNFESTFLIRKWWENYYVGNKYEIEYPGSRYIWGSRPSPTDNYAYALDLITGEQVLRPVTEKNSFLLFRKNIYNTLPQVETPEQSYSGTLPTAPAPTGYQLQTKSSGTTSSNTNGSVPAYINQLFLPVNITDAKTFDFEIKFNAIQTEVAGQNTLANLFIQEPFNKVKKVTFPNGQSRVDLANPPDMTVKVNLFYFYTNGVGVRIPSIIYNVEATVVPYSNLQYPATNVYSVSANNPVPKIEYIYTYRINLEGLPGFRNSDAADIVGPISIYDFRFKFPGYIESDPKNYGIYAMKNIPNFPNLSFPPAVGATKNMYTINKTVTEFITAYQSNPSLFNRFQNIFQGINY